MTICRLYKNKWSFHMKTHCFYSPLKLVSPLVVAGIPESSTLCSFAFFPLLFQEIRLLLGVVAHTFNPFNRKVETCRSVDLTPIWSKVSSRITRIIIQGNPVSENQYMYVCVFCKTLHGIWSFPKWGFCCPGRWPQPEIHPPLLRFKGRCHQVQLGNHIQGVFIYYLQ